MERKGLTVGRNETMEKEEEENESHLTPYCCSMSDGVDHDVSR